MPINSIILLIFLLIILFLIAFLFIKSVFNSIYYWIPQVWTFKSDFEIMKTWLDKYNLYWKKILDLGSWTWKSLRFFEKYFKAKPTWYEIDLSNYLISLILNKIYWLNADIKKWDFMKANLEEFDFIYIYLFPELMEKLKPLIFSKSKKWTIIFSNAFKFNDITPIEILLWKNWKEEVFVYEV